MKPAAVPLLLIALAVQAGRVTVQPGDAFRDSLLGLGAGDTLFFSREHILNRITILYSMFFPPTTEL